MLATIVRRLHIQVVAEILIPDVFSANAAISMRAWGNAPGFRVKGFDLAHHDNSSRQLFKILRIIT